MMTTISSQVKKFFSFLSISPNDIHLDFQDNHLIINLHLPPSQRGLFIGYQAHTLDAFQFLLSLIINNTRSSQQKLQVTLDIDNYRHQQLDKLLLQARQLADLVKQTHHPQPFPYLTPSQRRQIHLYFKDDPYVTTYSQGEGPNRTLYLAPTS